MFKRLVDLSIVSWSPERKKNSYWMDSILHLKISGSKKYFWLKLNLSKKQDITHMKKMSDETIFLKIWCQSKT